MELLEAFLEFLKARTFSLVRKFLLFVAVAAVTLGNGCATEIIAAFPKFLIFITAYLALYILNDIIDLERDRKKKILRPSKVIAAGKITVREAAVIAGLLLVFAFMFSSIYFTRYESLLLTAVIATGILRSFIAHEVLRTLSLIFLEFLNFYLFALFLGSSLEEPGSFAILAVTAAVYGLAFYFFRLYSKTGKKIYARISAVSILPVAVVAAQRFGVKASFPLWLATVILSLSWLFSLEKNSHKIAIAGFVTALFLLFGYIILG